MGDWLGELRRRVEGYNRGMYTLAETKMVAIRLMPLYGATELIAKLPAEILNPIRQQVAESANWTDADWKRLRFIGDPLLGDEDITLLRQKHDALRRCFSLG